MKETVKQNQGCATAKPNDIAQAPPAQDNPSPESEQGGCLPRPCSPDGAAFSEQDLFCIDFINQDGELQDSIQFARSPVQDTSHLYLLLKKVLRLFGNDFIPRVRPGKFGGVQKGKFTVLLGSGKYLEFDNISL